VPLVVPAKIRVPAPDALPRERLEVRLADAWRHRLTLVVAPAGSGKTTLVARFAAGAGVPVGWYRAETWDADEGSFVRHLEAALRSALPDLPGGWLTVEDVAKALETRPAPAAALVIDDGHALEGTEAEGALGRLVDYAPPWLAVIVACRVPPSINLPRMRVSGELLELGADDLRFRAWEVEQLFRDIYHDPVLPGDLAVLARRTEGWAAGLQLFHLATRGRSADERRRVLSGAETSGRLLREYLAQNVLFGLGEDLRRFLLDTCVLGRLSGPLCDRLRDATGSAVLLEELSRRSVFTVPVEDDDGAFRYHEVLRQHLDRMLVEEVGEAEARVRHARAGGVLEADGALPEALRAYCRAEDWPAVRRLLGGQGERLAATEGSAWVDAVPPAIERHDPWVALAAARRARNDGRWSTAIDGYVRAESVFGPSRAADAPRRERQRLAAWLDPVAMPTPDAIGALRSGLVREPVLGARDAARLDDPAASVARGLLHLAAGEVITARRMLVAAADAGEAGAIACAAARLGAAVAASLGGEAWDPRAMDRAIEEAERAGSPWLARLGRALAVRLAPRSASSTTLDEAAFDEDGGQDPWGRALLDLAEAWASAGDPERRMAAADASTAAFRRLGAGVLEAWARGLSALGAASVGTPDAREAALGAESAGRAAGSQAARMFAYAALAEAADDTRGIEHGLLAEMVGADSGLVVPRTPAPAVPVMAGGHTTVANGGAARASATPADPDGNGARAANGTSRMNGHAPSVRIQTLGGFALDVDGRRVVLDGAKPRVRSLLRLLAVHAGTAVHREVIQDALWPEADASAGARSLHVALSALRRWLDDTAGPIGGELVVREGDAYRLDVGADAVDVGRFDRALAEGRAAQSRGELASAAYALALELYGGELLPEEGPADWIVARRDHYREAAVEAAGELASASLVAGDTATAVRACRVGLEVDRYQDSLWRILIEARDRAGDTGAASRDRREYAAVLEGLGVKGSATVSVGPA
jgi:DNA-binding SARP family transcriptional activator